MVYQSFDAGFFDPGVYEWTVVWSTSEGIVWEASYPLTVLEDEHQLVVYNPETMTIFASQRSYLRHGFRSADLEEIWAGIPYQVQIFLDGEELETQQDTEIDYTDPDNPVYWWGIYQSFDAGFFEPGLHEWTVVWSTSEGIVWEVTYPLTVLEDGHRISVWNSDTMTFYESERSFVKHGFGYGPESMDEFWSDVPFDVQVFLGGNEIDLQMKTEIDWSNEEYPYGWFFYQNFDAWYFEPGEYQWTVSWSTSSGVILEETETLRILSSFELPSNLGVTIDYSHDAPGLYTTDGLQESLISYGSTINIIDDVFSIPESTNVLLIPASRATYYSGELSLLNDWLYSDGPRLLWIAGNSDFPYDAYFTPDSCNQILTAIGADLRLSADTVEDYTYNDGLPYRVAVQSPISDGELNVLFTKGVTSAIFHGPSSVLGFQDGEVVEPSSIEGVEVIMRASSDANPIDHDGSAGFFDYYSTNEIFGDYPMLIIQSLGDQKYVIVSGEVIFSDYQHMYDFFTYQGLIGNPYRWNDGRHDGQLLVNNILNWFGSLS
jgi:hypothetical protein